MQTTTRHEHTGFCGDPAGHALIGSPDDGSDLRESWCESEPIEVEGITVQVVDSPDGPWVRPMHEGRVPLPSWLRLAADSVAAWGPYVPAPRMSTEITGI
ncbi:hypothetical protein [Kineosporia sp. NBRC 101731]|uniref:hypothetical protein n=1 Tax=Kineosporia sp. NBRC 101731 TaxID=3032199 RepID=UPI0024A16F72|nr:hypothetical protein [Kineosporia sp. NBRC 101731]GLY32058.1 hypothetical protein Kisp02_54230 [Kineosporia sp. NBRC 101731]